MTVADRDECRPLLDEDGNVIASVRGEKPLSPEAETAMRALVAAAGRMFDADPEAAAMLDRQEAARERNRERLGRLGLKP